MLKKICILLLLFSVKEVYPTGDEVSQEVNEQERLQQELSKFLEDNPRIRPLVNMILEVHNEQIKKSGVNLMRKKIFLSILMCVYADYYFNGGNSIKGIWRAYRNLSAEELPENFKVFLNDIKYIITSIGGLGMKVSKRAARSGHSAMDQGKALIDSMKADTTKS